MPRRASHPLRRAIAPAAALGLALGAAGCDSLPGSFGPTDDDLRVTYEITAWGQTPISHVLVHPVNGLPGCSQPDDTTRRGRYFDGTIHRDREYEFHGAAGCYVLFVRFQDHPGFYQLTADLAPGEFDAQLFNPVPDVPAPYPWASGTLGIRNATPRPNNNITRIYTHACSPDAAPYGRGPTGGESAVRHVNIAPGETMTLVLPAACHFVTFLWSDGTYLFRNYDITASSRVMEVQVGGH